MGLKETLNGLANEYNSNENKDKRAKQEELENQRWMNEHIAKLENVLKSYAAKGKTECDIDIGPSIGLALYHSQIKPLVKEFSRRTGIYAKVYKANCEGPYWKGYFKW